MDTCTNCEEGLDPARFGRCVSLDGQHEFCAKCSGIFTALRIGDPTTEVVVAYDYCSSQIVDWMGGVLGTISFKQAEAHRVLYYVTMLDGSKWRGYGPLKNGNYVHLRRAKSWRSK